MNVGASTSPFSPNIADTLGDVIIFTAAGDPVFFKDLWDQNQRIAVVALLSFEALWMPFQRLFVQEDFQFSFNGSGVGMEVTENTESLTLVNSSHSVGRLGKLPLENVGCSFRTAPSKPKRRMVSAVRDFPLRCGPLALRIQSSEVLETLVPAKVLEQKNVVESVKDEPVEIYSLVSEALNKVVLSEPVQDLEDAAFDLSKIHVVGASASEEEMVSPSSLKSCSPSDVSTGSGLKKTMAKTSAPRRTVSAIRDFPPLCGRNAPRLSKEESLEVRASMKNKSLCQDESDIDDRPLEEMRKANVKQMGEDVQDGYAQKSELWGNSDHKSKTVVKIESRDIGGLEEKKGKEIVVYEKDSSLKRKLSDIYGYQIQLQEDFGCLEPAMESAMVQGLMAVPRRCWKQGKGVYKPYTAGVTSQSMGNKHNSLHLGKYESAITTKDKAEGSGVKLKTHKPSIIENTANHGISKMVSRDTGDSLEDDDECKDFYVAPRPCSFGVNFPHFEQSVSVKHHDSDAITRSKVRETLRLFQAICRKLLQEDEANGKERGRGNRRFDLQASKILKENGKYVNTGKQILGSVPGVEIGDEFHYRIELNIIGLHRQIQGGIDYVKHDGLILATSIVASGGYADDLDNSDSLIYTGQGGNVKRSFKEPEDQKLARGNLALKSSMQEKNPVRVIRGYDSEDGKTYVYDGLYLVEKCWQDLGPHGKLVFKFQLDRIPGQPELAWKEVKKSKKFKIREGLCVDDISQGKELIPICAVNTIDDEKPPPFKYITSMIYPNWCRPLPPKGCDCTNGCSDSEKCLCAVKNGGEIPYNRNGAIVEAKPLVYECGPSCKCSSSCHNRVCQHGIKFQLEIFKTKSRGWGVRSLNSIPSGSFICEYIGELLEEKEADQRTGNDEYLFDIGNNYNDSSLWDGLSSLMPDSHASSCEVVEGDCGFTIDAAQYANVGRFVNHSCSPNLYAQNLLYDHEDRRVPHIMFFSAENIPPLQELTYYYNYTIDQIRDSNGNIKKKSCFCGSIECTGRMY
ncbi:histone-lysine N-methyltransferase, H3 lysine-9 specific SUVH6-like [Quercus suber]|uniref:histone-lysine N-methyltransferase, H3 lysine-9 specific SUVH6-like n=2 Tax=Quercus suber TaxID=58331 RepID=UPI0032DE59F4